ncbi:MAG: DegT/DnrJ/EryC1/StrS family aminotransferase [Saprospiraceae bacterium]|nr:DegT/DnrJ/EryC1/StrS family aminotransferase [Saprospiraceae bacterium]
MVDLQVQYQYLKKEIDSAIQEVLESTAFINGPQVERFSKQLANYLEADSVITCANGTDALQIALMSLGLEKGSGVLVPAFTYPAAVEVILLLDLEPILVDVDPDTFNMDVKLLEKATTPSTKAIIPVHLFGQACDMESIMAFAERHQLKVIEDNAQSIGANYLFSDGRVRRLGTIGHIGCTSFFPSKNLGCFGDGGAIICNDNQLAKSLKMIANHGQSQKYVHEVVGCNSRLDTIQAAVLEIKLKMLDQFNEQRIRIADRYDEAFHQISGLQIPKRSKNSSHVFHQYTLKVNEGKRDALKKHLIGHKIDAMIYYPRAIHHQTAYQSPKADIHLPVAEKLAEEVISLPIYPEMSNENQSRIIKEIKHFFK